MERIGVNCEAKSTKSRGGHMCKMLRHQVVIELEKLSTNVL